MSDRVLIVPEGSETSQNQVKNGGRLHCALPGPGSKPDIALHLAVLKPAYAHADTQQGPLALGALFCATELSIAQCTRGLIGERRVVDGRFREMRSPTSYLPADGQHPGWGNWETGSLGVQRGKLCEVWAG